MHTRMGCVSSGRKAIDGHYVNENASVVTNSHNLKRLSEEEIFQISDTWWKFRKDCNCRYLFLSTYLDKNPAMNTKFRKKNAENNSSFHAVDPLITWNIRRFSVGIIEYMDQVVHDIEKLDFGSIYTKAEEQGAKHFITKRMVEPGDMAALTSSIQIAVATFHGNHFKKAALMGWKTLMAVITVYFDCGHAKAEENERLHGHHAEKGDGHPPEKIKGPLAGDSFDIQSYFSDDTTPSSDY